MTSAHGSHEPPDYDWSQLIEDLRRRDPSRADQVGSARGAGDAARWPPPRATSARRMGLGFRLAALIARPLLFLFTRERWAGQENVPGSGGVLVAANHISDIDPLVLAVWLYESRRLPHFLTKVELFTAPIFGRILRAGAQLPVWRNTSGEGIVLREATDALFAGEMVVLYPEGRETKDPAYWPETGKRGAAVLALTTGAPVIPVAQWGTQRIRGHEHAFRLLPRATVYILAGPPVDLSRWRGVPVTEQVLQDATAAIMADILALEVRIRQEPPPPRRGALVPRAARGPA